MLARATRPPYTRAVLIAILLCAFALRLINLTVQPLWFDEGWSVWFATSGLPAMIAATARDIHPPLYYALLHGWIALAGHGELALRLPSLMVGLMGVALSAKLAAALFDDPRVSLLAGLLVAVSPLQIFYAQEIRMYGLVTLLGVASSWLFWKLTDDGRRTAKSAPAVGRHPSSVGRYWIAYIVVTCAAMYTEYYGVFVPLFHFVYLILTARRSRQFLFPLISFISLFIFYLPWLLYAVPELVRYVGDKVGIEQYTSLTPLDYLARHLVAFAVGHLAADVAWLGWASVVFIVLMLWGIVFDVSRFTFHVSRPTLFLLCYLCVPLLAGYLIQLRFPFAPPRMERLLLLASPAFLMLVANGASNLRFKILDFKLEQLAAAAALIIIVTASAISLSSFYTVPRYSEQDYRALANRINALALPSDVVVLVHPWQVGFLQAYLAVPASLQLVADPAWGAADQAQLDAALNSNRRVWLPAYQTLGRILETEMEKYLTQNALPVEAMWYETTRLSFYASTSQPAMRAINDTATIENRTYKLRLGRIGIEPTTLAAGWGIIPLQLVWFSTPLWQTPFPHISLRLKDARQILWASQDRDVNLDLMRRKGALPDSQGHFMVYEFSQNIGFLIPAGTPPGLYRVTLTQYDGNSQQPIGQEIDIGDVTVIRPTTSPSIAALPIQTSLVADWPDVRLLGYSLRDGAWQAGDTLHLDLFWQAHENGKENDLMFVQLQDANGKALAIDEGATTYPMSQWQRGDLMREQRDVLLPATLAAGKYRLAVGWLRASDPVRVRLDTGGDQLVLREIDVRARPHRFDAPAAQTPVNIRFADVASLMGYDFTRDADRPIITLRLYWQSRREVDTAYKVFVHVVSPDGKTIAAQHDSPPANGSLPTTSWVSGEYIADEHTIQLPPVTPPNIPAGLYHVRVGLYDPQSGVRVPAFAADGHEYADDAAELLPLELK